MKFVFLLFLSSSFFFSANSATAQNFDYDRYKPRTLAELIELNTVPKAAADAKKEFLVSGDWFHSQVRLKYVGTSRALSAERKEILNSWKTSFKIPAETANMFEKEFLFKECDREFWLPVQKQVSEYFPKELKEGEMITVYLFFAGGLRINDKRDFLFLVNEFEK